MYMGSEWLGEMSGEQWAECSSMADQSDPWPSAALSAVMPRALNCGR